jgi:hypothetical protein
VIALALTTACSHVAEDPAAQLRLSSPPESPQLMFVSVASDDTFHRVALASLEAPQRGAFVTALSCERVYFGGNRGICLTSSAEGSVTSWWADIFDERFERLHRVKLTGPPSRVRVSSDGRLAASTVFESGHSYAQGGFSTRTTLFDLGAGTPIGDLEQFQTLRDHQLFRAKDFNFWGVTFARDNDTFFATLDTAGISYLVRGSVQKRTMEVVLGHVECPSLSPDNTRIAFKKRLGPRSLGWWQLEVLQLDTLAESAVTAETRSVDDQVEWLDDERVVYHLTGGSTAADLWAVRVDNSSRPQKLLESAYSPAVIRQHE